MAEAPAFEERLQQQANRLRKSGNLGRSDLLLRLFEFLVTQSLAGRAPKEIEIAQDVFDKKDGYDAMIDASVRVYIHRLRRKIDDFYAADRSGGDRLFIPKGEYRLSIVAAEPNGEAPKSTLAEGAPSLARPRRWYALSGRNVIWSALALLVVANVAAWFLLTRVIQSDQLRAVTRSAFWKPLASDGSPTVLVSGDYYIFGEAPRSMEVARLVREFSINSKDDLDQYLMDHPEDVGRFVDMGLHYLPTSIPQALRNILPIMSALTGGPGGRELVISMSQLTPDMLKKANIVYVGFLSGLGLLHDPVFATSGFQIGSSYDELIDRRTGKHYLSDQGDVTGRNRPRRDYGYIASLPGPSGTRVLIVGGTRDAAVLQSAEIVSDPHQLSRIAASVGDAPAFEALYEVRTLEGLNLGSTLILARGLHGNGLWNLDQLRRTFPDQGSPPS